MKVDLIDSAFATELDPSLANGSAGSNVAMAMSVDAGLDLNGNDLAVGFHIPRRRAGQQITNDAPLF